MYVIEEPQSFYNLTQLPALIHGELTGPGETLFFFACGVCPAAPTLRFCSDSSTHARPSPSQDPSGGQYCQLSCTAAYAGTSQFSLFST